MNSSERFAQIFRGRTDYYGAWDGGAVEERVTLDHYAEHLDGLAPMGVYMHLGSAGCTWGCIDIDGGDFPQEGARDKDNYSRKDPEFHDWYAMEVLAENLIKALGMKQVWGHLERTRNGYHVWVFPTVNVPASEMRRALMAACVVCKYDPNEVNPKQEILAEGKIGNYVRLPYPDANNSNWSTGERMFINSAGVHVALETALDMIEEGLTEPAAIKACAALWTPPARKQAIDTSAPTPGVVARLKGLGRTIWDEGPLPGSDRSSTLAHLAHLCREDEISVSDAYAVIVSADLRWAHKFHVREDGEEQMKNLVERAYAT